MFYRRFTFLFLILILVFLLMIPGVVFADDTNSNAQQYNNQFRIEVTKNGFNGTSEELRIEVEEGQEIEIIFEYIDDTSFDNQHIIYISDYNTRTDVLGKDNPEVSLEFTANKTGVFYITCILNCTGHNNLRGGNLLVFPASGLVTMRDVTLDLDAPDQAETGQSLTLTALIKDEFEKPVKDYLVRFFIKSDFFVNSLMEIGEEVTDEQGLAKIDYISNEAGVLQIVARYEVNNGLNSVEAEREVDVTGNSEPIYQTLVGIQFPNGLLIWMMALVAILLAAWSTFIFVLYQVRGISWGTGTKGISLILMIIVAALFIMLMLVLITQEPQYNYNLFPS